MSMMYSISQAEVSNRKDYLLLGKREARSESADWRLIFGTAGARLERNEIRLRMSFSIAALHLTFLKRYDFVIQIIVEIR